MTAEVKEFLEGWAREHVHNNPLVDGERYERHIRSLWTACVVSASEEGYALPQIEQAVGDLEDFLRDKFEDVFDPTVGGIKD